MQNKADELPGGVRLEQPTASRREELATRLACAMLGLLFKNEAGEIQGIKATCLHAIVCADAMIEEFDKDAKNG